MGRSLTYNSRHVVCYRRINSVNVIRPAELSSFHSAYSKVPLCLASPSDPIEFQVTFYDYLFRIMSTDSIALLRKNAGQDIRALAQEHFKHDLQDSDRDALTSAAGKISTHVSVGSALGLALGAFLAFRLRRTRMQMFNAFRAHEKPTHVKFADGREGASISCSVNVCSFRC